MDPPVSGKIGRSNPPSTNRNVTRATSPGQGTYYLRYKDDNNKTCHQKLGRTTDTTLAEARKKAKLLKAEIALGADPRGEEKARKAVPTYAEFFNEHYLPHVKPRKRSWAKDEEMFRLRLNAVFGKQRLNEITRQKIQMFHTSLKNEGLSASTCNHYVKLLKHSLNLAIDWDMLDINPAVRVPLFSEADNIVENYLGEAELERLMGVLLHDDNRAVCRIVLYLLSTGARLNEALSARWDQVDIERRVWKIPASNSKSKRVRSVPLNDSAIAILKQLDTKGQFEHLFINWQTGKPYTTISKVWGRLRKNSNSQFRIKW
ncbi:MAG: tyrosine-type recombinase/integrase [Methyloprofundus sp.]|nr:tyrosine-type recombinase/integrase [Methyloprofundus sp.]